MIRSGPGLLHSASLIYDFNAMKGPGEVTLKIAQPFKTEQFQAWKIEPSSFSLNINQETVLTHLKMIAAKFWRNFSFVSIEKWNT